MKFVPASPWLPVEVTDSYELDGVQGGQLLAQGAVFGWACRVRFRDAGRRGFLVFIEQKYPPPRCEGDMEALRSWLHAMGKSLANAVLAGKMAVPHSGIFECRSPNQAADPSDYSCCRPLRSVGPDGTENDNQR